MLYLWPQSSCPLLVGRCFSVDDLHILNEPNYNFLLVGLVYSIICGFGVTAGAHRYWAHRSYKVTRPLYFILLILQTAALQDCVIEWVKDHRIHHKYSDTNADPHNANRGFFFSHIGWMMCKLHPDVEKYSQRIDMSDLTSDPYLRFQKKWAILRYVSIVR